MAEDKTVITESEMKESNSSSTTKQQQKTTSSSSSKSFISRVFGIFRSRRDDFEKRLEYISKEEASVIARMRKRARNSTSVSRYLIMFSVLIEVVAVVYAIMTTRSMDLDWKMRAVRVLPMFVLPVLSALLYSGYNNFIRMCERKDQKTLERLRAERLEKINELKERTNYYTTQQLIQRYDPDPAAKAAAATVLASKLGADSGLQMYLGEENLSAGQSNDAEVAQHGGLRNRKQVHTKSNSTGSAPMHQFVEEAQPHSVVGGNATSFEHNQQLVVNHYDPQGSALQDGGWIARIAALLVGEDPTQSFALICGNCHMHNGLARKEDFPFITYYCPHCQALNRPKQQEDHVSDTSSPRIPRLVKSSERDMINKTTTILSEESEVISDSPVKALPGIEETTEKQPLDDMAS
ncbi:hypothetical protein ACFE04_010877 [Oxalis oulophora]